MNTRQTAHAASIAAFILLASLAFPPAAHAATTVQLNDPFTDALQLWSEIATSIDIAAHQLAAALGQQQPLTTNSPQKPHAPRNLTPPLPAQTALATEALSETAITSPHTVSISVVPQQPQSRSPPSGTSDATTIDPPPAPAASASAFVTQDQFNAVLSALGNSVRQLISESASNPLVSGAGAPLSVEEFAPSQAIDQLSGVTITTPTINSPTITGGSVSGATLSGTSLSAGATTLASTTITGGLTLTGGTTFDDATTTTLFASLGNFTTEIANTFNASVANIVGLTATNATTTNFAVLGTSYFAGNVGIGTTSPSALLTLDSTSTNGTILRISNASTGGHIFDLLSTGSGNIGGAGRLDIFDRTSGLARLSIAANGNVGVGTTSPFTNFAVNGNGYFSGALTAQIQDSGGQEFNVKAYGAKGDGVTDDTAAINAAVTAAYNAGGGTVVFAPGKYVLSRRIANQQQIGGIWLLPGVSFEGNGAELVLRGNTEFFEGDGAGSSPESSVVTQNIVGSTTAITVTNGSLFAPGNTIYYVLVQDGGTSNESSYGFAKIASINGNTLTLDRTINANLIASTVSDPANASVYLISNPLENIHIDNFYLYNDIANGGNAEEGIQLTHAQGVSVSNIRAQDPGAGVVNALDSENISINNINIDSSIAQNGQSSKGRVFSFAESKDISVNNVTAADVQGVFAYAEYYSRNITIDNVNLVNTLPESSPGDIFGVMEYASTNVENMKISGNGNFNLYSTGGTAGGTFTIRNLELETDTDPYSLAIPGVQMTGTLHLLIGTTTDEYYDLDNGQWTTRTIYLQNGQSGSNYYLPSGITSDVQVYVPPSVNPATDLPVFYIGRTGDNGFGVSSQLISGQQVQLSPGLGSVGGSVWSLRNQNLKILISTAASGMAGKYVIVRALIFQPTSGSVTNGNADSTSYPDTLSALANLGGITFATTTTNSLPFFTDPNTLTGSGLYWDNINTRLGIGTSTPGSLLSLNGIANFTSATSTFYSTGGVNLAAGCFAVAGNCLGLGNLSGVLGVANGGTGATTFGQGWIYSNGTTGALAASTSPTVSYLTATSTTGTNYFAGLVNTSGTSGGYEIDNNLILQASSTNFSTLLGSGAGVNLVSAADYNTALGYQALGNATSSQMNVAIGYQALKGSAAVGNTGPNLAIGYQALFHNTSGSGNVSLNAGGNYGQALFSNTTGSSNIGIGAGGTLYSNTTGSNNIGIGSSMYFNQTGSSNIGIGNSALGGSSGNSFSYNEAIGQGALGNLVTGGDNIALGYYSVPNMTTGGDNVGIGTYVLQDNTTGSDNVAIGGQTGAQGVLSFNTSATNTVAVGFQAGRGTASYQNQGGTLLGFRAGLDFQTGSDYNTLLGYSAGSNITTGAGNLVLGANVLAPSATASNQLNIGNVLYGTGIYSSSGSSPTQSSAPTANGFIGIGTSTPYSRLEVWGPDAASSTSLFTAVNNSSTTVFAVFDGGNAELSGTLTQSSDQRLKTNIQSLNGSSSLAAIDALNPVTFNWIDPSQGSTPQLGFIAQEVQSIFPSLVSTTSPTILTPNGTLGLNYIDLVSPIVSAIQALSTEITSLETTIAGFAQSITTHILTADDITANNELCIGKTCVTETQLQALLASTNQSPAGGSTSSSNTASSTTPDTPPVISINGDNPAIIQVGSTYTDLGATITGPQQDLNLGIVTYLNGAPVSQIQLDTSAAATDTIDYVVTDQSGLIATSTRTVIIQAANDNNASATTTPANDNQAASSSAATTTLQ